MSDSGCFKLALCQFPVTEDIARNAKYMERFIDEAAADGADVAFFSECCLSGYGGVDFCSWDGYDWELLAKRTEALLALAAKHQIWLIFGSSHRLTEPHKPYNCMYVVNPQGQLVDRYDKRFCTGGDLVLYSAGDHLSIFEINGVRCGIAICYDVRFPELFRAYQQQGVQVMFHPFHNVSTGHNIHSQIMRPSVQACAAINYFWAATTNASNHYQSHPSSCIRPDGTIATAMRQHRTGWIIADIDTNEDYYDASGPYRSRAIGGILNSADPPADDARSTNRTNF